MYDKKFRYRVGLSVLKHELIAEILSKWKLLLIDYLIVKEYSLTSKRVINFDSKLDNKIYQLKTNFIEDKIAYNKNIAYTSGVEGFYALNKFYVRDTDLANNSLPIVETLDICLKRRAADFKDFSQTINLFYDFIKVINECIKSSINNKNWELVNKFQLNDNKTTINFDLLLSDNELKDFKNDVLVEDMSIAKAKVQRSTDSYIERLINKNGLIFIKNWNLYNSKYFNSYIDYYENNSYKVLLKKNRQIYDLATINIFEKENFINIIFNLHSLVLIVFRLTSLLDFLDLKKR